MLLTNEDYLNIERDLCKRSFADFVKRAWPVLEPSTELKWGWAVQAICDHLEAVHYGQIKRLLMNVPPGSMKSLLVGVMFPAWEWGPRGRPETRYLGTAHKQDLAVRDNMKCPLPSRVNNNDSAIIIIMQRLHENDVSAHALELGYDHLVIPMRYEGESRSKTALGWTDPRTQHGELMFPERFSEQQVVELEDSLLEYATAGQLQQRPSPRAGGLIKPERIEIVDALPAKARRFTRGWDLAATKDAGDATAGVKLTIIDGVTYIIDLTHARGTADEVENLLVSTSQLDGNDTTQSIPQDPGQAGKSQASYLSKKLAGVTFEFTTESGDKAVRASPVIAQINAGNVKMVRAPWNQAFIEEMKLFPKGKYDDRIDGLSRAYNKHALDGYTDYGSLL